MPSACMDRRTRNRSCIAPQSSTQATLGAAAPDAKQEGALSGRTGDLWLVHPLPLAPSHGLLFRVAHGFSLYEEKANMK